MIPPTFTEETKREFGKLIESLPKRVSETPDGVIESFLLSRTSKAYELGKKSAEKEHNECASELTNIADEMFVKGREAGRAEMKKEVEKAIEKTKKVENCSVEALGYHTKYCENCEYNSALSDLLARLEK